ncbi:DoxX family protein [Pontibacillus sp. HN14]|uniref:DoxX family protein n=1 Tax=Pontibacillus chungwhensis TaxID=265426 RepID=A0ABY8V3S0_9BACI|nr:DoxX family protein [Pontibacillus chungwhensis]MCD5325787.1 DoxX family protein [Pontibacillus sp. HN14]WIG00104.1 DoxX family protein [Pontibacillus chungwhensis]
MVKGIGLVLFSLFFIVAGVIHFTQVEGFAAMIPDVIPFRNLIVYVTGVIEWILAILLLIPSTRRQAGIWTAVYLVLIFPANIYAAIAGIPAPGSEEANTTLLWVRLLFQPLLIWWVLAVSKVQK